MCTPLYQLHFTMKDICDAVAFAKAPHPNDGLEPLPYRSPLLFEYLGGFVQQLPHFLIGLGYEPSAFRFRLFFDIEQNSSLKPYTDSIAGFSAKSFCKSRLWESLSFSPFIRRDWVIPRFQRMATSATRLNSRKVSITCRIR